MTKHLEVLEEIVTRWNGTQCMQKKDPKHYKLYKKTIDKADSEIKTLQYAISIIKQHEAHDAIEDSGLLPVEKTKEDYAEFLDRMRAPNERILLKNIFNSCREETKARLAKNLSVERIEKIIAKECKFEASGNLELDCKRWDAQGGATSLKQLAKALNKELLGGKELC